MDGECQQRRERTAAFFVPLSVHVRRAEVSLEGADHRLERNVRIRRKSVAVAGEMFRNVGVPAPHPKRMLRFGLPTRGRRNCWPHTNAGLGELLPREEL